MMVETIRSWVESILGEYEPITYIVKGSVAYSTLDGGAFHDFQYEKVADGLAGLDWNYIVTALLLLVTIYSVFRLLGVLLQALSGGSKW